MQLELVADKLAFPEGPIVFADGSIIVTEIAKSCLTMIRPNGDRTIVAEVGGGPNGAAIGPDGAIYVCNNGGRFEWVTSNGMLFPGPNCAAGYSGGSIQRVDLHTGGTTTIYKECENRKLLAPNDIVFDAAGGFWFTDHGMRDGETLTYGALYYALPDGSHIKRVRKHMLSPNGVGLSPDGSMLYVADTLTARLYAMPVESPGKLQRSSEVPGPIIATLPGHQGFDSLAVQADGQVCVATLYNGGISVIGLSSHVEHIAFPDPATTNIAFGGPGMQDAFVTCSGTGRLFRCHWTAPGLELNFSC